MGVSTVVIGALPAYDHRRSRAAAARVLPFRSGARSWRRVGGRVLLAIENAPPGKAHVVRHVSAARRAHRISILRRHFSAFSRWLKTTVFRLRLAHPFLASAALVFVGLYVRLRCRNARISRRTEPHRPGKSAHAGGLPKTAAARCRHHLSLATFVLFYLMTVFALSWGTTALGYSRDKFLADATDRHRYFSPPPFRSAPWSPKAAAAAR